MPHSNYAAPLAAASALSHLWLEATTVMTLRLWMLGWEVAPRNEARRMVDEKLPACASATCAAWHAGARAALRAPFDPLHAAAAGTDAWARSLTRKTRSNRRRLTRR